MREGESESEQYSIITHLGNKGRAWNHPSPMQDSW